jgi:hypothetical protein
MSNKKDFDFSEEQSYLNVLKHQSGQLNDADNKIDRLICKTEDLIADSENLLECFDKVPKRCNLSKNSYNDDNLEQPQFRPWAEIVKEAETFIDTPAVIGDILIDEEIEQIEQKIIFLRGDFDSIHRLDKLDWAICGVAGILAALVDVFLVKMPAHPGFLGGKASEGGPLSNWIKEQVNNKYIPAEIRQLENENWVPYDASTSNRPLKKHCDRSLYPL